MWVYLPETCLPSSRESEASSSGSDSPTPEPALWVTSSGTPMRRPLSWPGWRTRPWSQLLSGTTLPPSTAARGAASWIRSLADSRVRTSVSRGRVPVSTASGPASGASSPDWFARWDHESSSWRTSQLSLLGDSTVCSRTWPAAGSMRNGMCSARPESAPRTFVEGSSYSRNEYPTPSATPYGSSQNEGRVEHKRPTNGTPSLETWARGWPTPGANDWKGSSKPGQRRGQLDEAVAHRWATPTAGDAKASGSRNAPDSRAHLGTSLTDQIRTGDSHGRRDRATAKDGDPTSRPAVLSPAFVEALMGFPRGWSIARTGFAASETAWFRRWRRWLGTCSPSDCEERADG